MHHARFSVAVGLSGGVDSSVAALLLKRSGQSVIGITMRIYSDDLPNAANYGACYGPDEENEIQDARAMCDKISIPYEIIDLRKEYRETVLEYFKNEYKLGRTPNPCVKCNHTMKFGFLISKANEQGVQFDKFATGHYARVNFDDARKRYIIQQAVDTQRDQSYFISMLTQKQLANVIFPLGELKKIEVRKIAEAESLTSFNKPDSQNFVAGDYTDLTGSLPEGDIVDNEGRVLGKHKGINAYTVGQRRGLGIASAKPLYVIRIDPMKNQVIVGTDEQLFQHEFNVRSINYVAVEKITEITEAKVKIRSSQAGSECKIIPNGDDLTVHFSTPERAITPGQTAVFYDNGQVLAAGTIYTE